jgi:hypothetical protein
LGHQLLLADADQVGDQSVVVPDLRTEGDSDMDCFACGTVLAGTLPGSARPGFEMDSVAELLQITELGVRHDDHLAASATVASVGSTPRDVFFSTERDTAVPAVPSRHMDLCLIEEHGRPREERAQPQMRAEPLLGDDADDTPHSASGEDHFPSGLCEESVVGADAYIGTRAKAGAPLPHQDGTGFDRLAGECLHTQALSVGVAAIPRAAATFLVSHLCFLPR